MTITTKTIQQYLKEDKIRAVEFEICTHCNLSCNYCPNSITPRADDQFFDFTLYKKIIGELENMNFIGRISYDFYNEPLLHTNLEKFIRYAKKFLPKSYVHIFSNGVLLTKDRLLTLIDNGMDHITITRHHSINFKKQDFLHEARFTKYLSLQSYNDITLFNRGGILNDIGPQKIKPLTPCYIPSFLISITASGNVLSCYEDFYESNIMGNCYQQSLQDIWHSEKFKQLKSDLRQGMRHKHTPCKKCNRINVMPGIHDI